MKVRCLYQNDPERPLTDPLGVDSENYKGWLPASEVFEGSQAVHFSLRPFANIGKG